MCKAVDVQPSLPRRCGRQTHRSNVPAENRKEYFHHTIIIPILDHLLAEMETRFSKHQQTTLNSLYLIPSIITTKSLVETTSQFTELEEMYGEDLPHSSSLQSEVHSWYLKWREQKEEHGIQSLPTNLAFTLTSCFSPLPEHPSPVTHTLYSFRKFLFLERDHSAVLRE